MRNPYKEITDDIAGKQHQEKAIEYLSELGFTFLNYTTLKSLVPHFPRRFWKWQFMVRIAKPGIPDKYDFQVLFAFKIMGKHMERIYMFRIPIMWVNSEKSKGYITRPIMSKKVLMPWKEAKIINFKKKKTLTKFPDILTIQERIDWRKMNDRMVNPKSRVKVEGKNLAWYLKYKAEILKLNPHIKPY